MEGLYYQVRRETVGKFQLRADNHKLLELNIIFLGGIPLRGVHFHYPEAIHRARWMTRATYFIKIWLFGNEYLLQKRSLSSCGSSNCESI